MSILKKVIGPPKQVQREYTPTEEISTITGQPKVEWTPTAQPPTALTALLKTGFVDDPQAEIKILSKARGIPESNYRVEDGEIIYQDPKDGKWYPETKKTISDQARRFFLELPAYMPSGLMGAAGLTSGPIVGGMGFAGGEGLRQYIGDKLTDTETPPLQGMAKMGLAAGEGLLGYYGGKALTGTANKIGARRGGLLADYAGPDRKLLNAAKTRRIEDLYAAHNVTPTAPQTTGSSSLEQYFNVLGDIPESSPLINAVRNKQYNELDDLAYRFLDSISPADVDEAGDMVTSAARKAVQRPIDARKKAAKPLYEKAFKENEIIDTDQVTKTIKDNETKISRLLNTAPEPDMDTVRKTLQDRGVPIMQQRSEGDVAWNGRLLKDYERIIGDDVPMKGGKVDIDSVKRYNLENEQYRAALEGKPTIGVDIPMKKVMVDTRPAIKEIDSLLSETVKGDPSHTALKRIRGMITEAGGNLQKLDRVKRSGIDNVLDKTKVRTMKREFKRVKDALVGAMDEASPDYKLARNTYELDSDAVKKIGDKTVVSRVAKYENDEAIKASKELFKTATTSPGTMRRARAAIVKEDPAAWDAALKVHLQELYEKTKMPATGKNKTPNIGGNFYKRTWGDPQKRRVLKEAMTPEQYQYFEEVSELFGRAGQILGKESTTAPRQKMLEKIGGSMFRKFVRSATQPLVTKSRLMGEYAVEGLLARNAKKLATAMIDQRASDQLKKLRQLSPGSEEFIPKFMAFLSSIGFDIESGGNLLN